MKSISSSSAQRLSWQTKSDSGSYPPGDGLVCVPDSACSMPTRSYHVLLIEDEDSVRLLLREHLELRGYACHEASHGAEALRMLQSLTPDAIVCDITMPVMGGIEFLVKSRAMGCTAPILLLTGVDDSSVRTLGRDAGAYHCISKPPDFDELDRLLRLSIAMQS